MQPLADTGRVIAGRYRLEAPIGRGAMGVVWRARDQLLDRDVAIKEVHIADTLTEAERATAFQRTLREAKTAARLNHPAVVTVYDVAEDGGRPWIVMQLVHAQSLDQVLATSGPLSPRRAADMARQLLSALSVAHAAGVMHRDVKPSNVLLGSDDRAVLTDFGIATFADDPKLTQTGMVMGSPGFTAPERIRGEDASPASDLWSLGATLFAAVEGHGPFEQRGGAITTMSAIINEEAPEAPAAGALGPVIAALLRREPVDRPDASAAARMIADVLPRLPDRPPGTPTGYEATALSASSRPASPQPGSAPPGSPPPGSVSPGSVSPGSVRPRAPQPGENAFAYEPTVVKPPDSPAGRPARRVASRRRRRRPPRPRRSRRRGGRPISPPGTTSRPGPERRPAAPVLATRLRLATARRAGRARGPSRRRVHRPGPAPSTLRPGADAPAWAGRPLSWHWRSSAPRPGRPRSCSCTAIIPARPRARARARARARTGTGSASGSASGSSSATLPPATLQIIDAINQRATGPLPSGFTTTSQPAAANETAGFSIAAPTSWQKTTNGYQTYLQDPTDPNTNILIDLTPHTYQDMLQEAQYIEQRSISRFPGYHRVGMAATNVRGTTGSWWKFTWNNKGVQQEALDVLFVAHTSAGPQSYALYMTAPVSQFDQMRPTFDEEVETFATLPA